jgi:hypothetical protein
MALGGWGDQDAMPGPHLSILRCQPIAIDGDHNRNVSAVRERQGLKNRPQMVHVTVIDQASTAVLCNCPLTSTSMVVLAVQSVLTVMFPEMSSTPELPATLRV